jgi:Papain-like cysteine protease AvrRpt2
MSLIDDTRVPLFSTPRLRAFALVTPPPVTPPTPPWARLNLAMQHQLQDNWCWAAVSTSIAGFFGVTTWTQCSVVSKEVDDASCCSNGSSSACNVPWRLDKALRRVNALKKKSGGMPDDLKGVRREIDAGRPVCVRIGWSGGGGHFIAIEGYRADDASVAVEDPWHGSSDVPLAHFRTGRYQGTGAWTHTYYTKKP